MEVLDRNKDGEVDKNDFFTGNNSKKLLVHVMQDNVEVSKPIKTQIWRQQVEWKQRIFPIVPARFIVDSKGQHHQYVNVNDVSVLSFNKDHADKCRKCGGKMFIDARNARDLVKRKTIEAIWGIDSTHIILLIIVGIMALMAMAFAFVMFNENTKLNQKIDSAISTGNLGLLTTKFILPIGAIAFGNS